MRITVLAVPDCPNGPVARERLDAAVAGRGVEVETLTVSDEAEAARWGMTGSPTILIDGSDPFRQAGAVPSLSCRVYRHSDGRTDGAPGVDELRRALAAEDFLMLDEDGRITAAYPFSAVPTPHRVVIKGGAQVWAMCAIDALGIPAMLGTDATIHSSDPVTGEPVTVTVTVTGTSGGVTAQWQPPSTVVFLGRRSCSGPAATVCCDVLNFFTSAVSARTWIAS